MGPLRLDMYLSFEVVKVRRNVKETLKIWFQLQLQLEVPWQAQQACRLWCMEITLRGWNNMRSHELSTVGIASDLYTWRCAQKLWKRTKLKISSLISYVTYRLLQCYVRNYWSLCNLYNNIFSYDVQDRLYGKDIRVYNFFSFHLNAHNMLNTHTHTHTHIYIYILTF